jgi:predicted small secreted protein
MKKSTNYVILGAVLAALCTLAACNTIKGFGEDVEKGGQHLQKSSDRNR